MRARRKELREALSAVDDGPAGLGAPVDLVFDDDPIEDIVYMRDGVGPTPADLMRVVREGRDIKDEMEPALAAMFAKNHDYLEEVRRVCSAEQFARLIPMVWQVGRDTLEPRPVISMGVWLGFYGAAAGDDALSRRAWGQLSDLYRDRMRSKAHELDGLVEHAITELGRAAGEYWEGRRDAADGKAPDGAALFLASIMSDSVETVDPDARRAVDALIGMPGFAGLIEEAAGSSGGTAGEGTSRLAELVSIALAVAAVAGERHAFVADCLNRIFVMLSSGELTPELLEVGKRGLEIREAAIGYDHPLTTVSRANLGAGFVLAGDLRAASAHLGNIRSADPSNEHLCYWLARFYQARGDEGDDRLEAQAWRAYLNGTPSSVGRRWEATRRLSELESS